MKLFKQINNIKLDSYVVFLLFFLQFATWFLISQRIKPDFTITPLPPSRIEMDIASLGDEQFAYRMYGQLLQNAGDTFGETVPLKDYDFNKLEQWFYAVDALSSKSEYIPSIAAFYYGQSQNTEDCRYIIKYLIDHADKNPVGQWRWYMEAIYLGSYRMKDYEIVKPLAEKIISLNNKDVPLWAKTLVPFMIQRQGDVCSAYEMLIKINEKELQEIANDNVLSAKGGEYNFLLKLISEKIQMVKNNPELLATCLKNK